MTEFIDSDGDDDIVALIFDHKPASPKTPPSGRKNNDSRASPKTPPSGRKNNDSKASTTTPSPTVSRATPSPPKNETQTRRSPPPTSQQIANERYAAMIDSMLGTEPEMNGKKLKVLLRNFALFEPAIASKVENAVKIDEDRFDVAKLKELLVAAATQPGESKLAKRIRPSVIAALSNRPPSPWYRQKPMKKASPRQSPATKTQKVASQPASPTKGEESADSYDADEEPPKQQATPKKRVSPGKASPKGEKYFPGFYDNIDY